MKVSPKFTLHLKESVQADLPTRAHVVTELAERRDIFAKILQQTGSDGNLDTMTADRPLVEVLLAAD